MSSSILPPPPPPPSFQPLRQARASKNQRAHRLSVSSTSRNPFTLLPSNATSTSPFASGQGLLKPPPVALLNDRRTTRTGASKRLKPLGATGKMRESRWEHGTLGRTLGSTGGATEILLDLNAVANSTLGLGLGAPISLGLNARSTIASALDAPLLQSSAPVTKPATSDLLTPPGSASSSPTRPTSFDASSLSSLGSLASSRRHSRLGMLKHRNKALSSNAVNSSILKEQHPRSPSIDITSVFPQANPGEGEAGDAFQLFEEAFPYPTNDQVSDSATSPLVKLLSSPMISTSMPAPSSVDAGAAANASASAKHSPESDNKRTSIGSVKGLKELELVKRRLSWESIASATQTTPLHQVEDPSPEQDAEDEPMTDEEKFQDALEDSGMPDIPSALLPSPPRISATKRSTFPSIPSNQISPIVSLATEDTISFGLGLGIDMPARTSRAIEPEQVQGPLKFDELKERDDKPLAIEDVKGLGIDRFNEPATGIHDGMGLGLGLGLGLDFEGASLHERRTVGQHIEEEKAGMKQSQKQLEELFEDPPTPLLAPASSVAAPSDSVAPSTPILSTIQRQGPASVKHVSPRRQPRSPPRAKKVSLLKLPTLSQKMKNQKLPLQGGQVKRIYPRTMAGTLSAPPEQAELGRKIKEAKLKSSLQHLVSTSNTSPMMQQEDTYYGSPNLSDLPGSFLASPVLPTSFADFSHSPLSPSPTPTPTATRFARMRRGGNQTAPLPDYTITAQNSLSPILPTTTPGASTSTYCPPVASSSSSSLLEPHSMPGTPTLVGTPTLAASPSLASDISAPSTPVPDQVVQNATAAAETTAAGAAAAAAAEAGHAQGAQMNQQLFDAAIASTILGAIVCIGAVSWLAISVFRKSKGDKRKGYSGRGIGSDDSKRFSDDLDDEKYRASAASTPRGGGNGDRLSIAARGISAPILTDLPKPPPLARLSFPPGNHAGSDPTEGPERSFSSHFDAWVDASTRRALQGASTEDHGGYPEEAVRGDGMSTNERRMSRASRHSVQSFATASKNYSRSLHTTGNRSSYRSSTGPSLIDSTWSARPGTSYSSRTSHHDPLSKEYTGLDSTAPPRLPSPILRNSIDTSDVAAYFATPPDTPTKSLRAYLNEAEPPVPSLPSDYRDLASSVSSSNIKTRPRGASRSNGSKTATSASKASALKSNMKTMPALNSIITPDEGHESPTEAALRKLEKRRATVDGGILADGLQALLFQAQLDSPTKGITDSNTQENPDLFNSSSGGNGSAQIKRNSATLSTSASSSTSGSKSKSPKKSRPQTMPHMPPTIVVSSDQQVPPPTPGSRQRTRSRTKTSDSNEARHPDPRASIKTYEQNLPWLAHSPSSNFSVHPRDDAGSVIDPEMRSIRHFSVDTNRFSVDSMPAPPKRFSQDFASFAAGRASQHAALDSLDIASRRLASEDDLASQGGDGGHDTDEEEARRTQRRKTLLYSVYKQRGVDLSPTSAALAASPSANTSSTSPDSLNTLSRTSLSDESNVDTPTKGVARDQLVNSFPSPPPLPEAPAFASLVANLESTMDAAASLAGPSVSATTAKTNQPPTPSNSVKSPGRSRTETVAQTNENDPTAAFSPTSPAPPARPPKSPIRMSIVPDSAVSPSSRIPLPSRQPVRQPFSNVNSANGGVNSIRGPLAPSASSTAVSKPTTVSAPPVRSFAAELQESVGNPAEGYDSDTLMSGMAWNKPGRSFFANAGSMSNSSSGYGFGGGMYSTNPGSMESMEEVVAISQAETVQFGRSRASGIPQFSWRRNTAGIASSGIGQYDSEESAYEESDAETAMFRARMEPIAE
ncbi:uncharacterized protein JCM15063_000512 [Sporobolomyces koalae]|uniref:uncharacterized protein n=1 Tax=Sporobolomyces koalae TaxID=500713 RepID=UPI00316E2909